MEYDIIIIGSGPGGYAGAVRASQLGFKTAIVEKENLGGICLNWGCIPTKALLKSAQVLEYARHGEDYGIRTENVKPDFKAVVERSRKVAAAMNKGVAFLMKKNKIDVLSGVGRLLKGKTVEVTSSDGEKTLHTAKHIVIATGARSRELAALPQDGKTIIGYRGALYPEKQPESMIVVGSGAIGTELAYFYNAMGTRVTLVEYMASVVPTEDAEVSAVLEKSLRGKGIEILTCASVEKAEKTAGGVRATIKTAKGTTELEAEVILSAAGIQANIEGIGLEEVGIETENGRIRVDDFYRTSVEGYYAIGDVIPGPALAHVATAEAVACIEKIKGLPVEKINYRNIPGCIYTSPQAASVGFTEEEARKEGYEVRVGKFPFSASGKANAAGASEGFIKVVFDAKYGELLGASMVGDNVTEMIAEAVLARQAEATGQTILKAVHPHPTMSEAFMGATAAAYKEAIDL